MGASGIGRGDWARGLGDGREWEGVEGWEWDDLKRSTIDTPQESETTGGLGLQEGAMALETVAAVILEDAIVVKTQGRG